MALEVTDIQRRNLEILIMDARYWAKHKKKHPLTNEEVDELLEIVQCDTKCE